MPPPANSPRGSWRARAAQWWRHLRPGERVGIVLHFGAMGAFVGWQTIALVVTWGLGPRSMWFTTAPTLACLAVQITGLVILLRSAIKRRRGGWRRCPACEYSLEGLDDEGACPECGAAYTPTSLKNAWQHPAGRWSSPPNP